MDTQAPLKPSQSRKGRKIRTSRRSRAVDLEKLKRRLMTVLARETDALMDLSFGNKKLAKDDAVALTNYLKAVKELAKDDDGADLTPEQLEKLAGIK